MYYNANKEHECTYKASLDYLVISDEYFDHPSTLMDNSQTEKWETAAIMADYLALDGCTVMYFKRKSAVKCNR